MVCMGGSSPRARGTRGRGSARFLPARFIPAGAGNTPPSTGADPATTVHPRGRGEHVMVARPALAMSGSSPRARGTQQTPLANRYPDRFIPAGAGNTCVIAVLPPQPPVHPRGRGEHSGLCLTASWASGSSPRARGTPVRKTHISHMSRFIPAGAGNTGARVVFKDDFAVHPRGRGEHATLTILPTSIVGSSPRARGTHIQKNMTAVRLRFIPAGAGNTLRNKRS